MNPRSLDKTKATSAKNKDELRFGESNGYLLTFLNGDELIATSCTARKFQQPAVRAVFEKWFPTEYARFQRESALFREQKMDVMRTFYSVFEAQHGNTWECENGKDVKRHHNARHARLIKFFKEGRLAEIKKEKQHVSPSELYEICDGQGTQLVGIACHYRQQAILDCFHQEISKRFTGDANNGAILQECQNRTKLHLAAELNQIDEVTRLLRLDNVPREWGTRYQSTPLTLAATSGHVTVLTRLVEKKANMHAKSCYGHTPITKAAMNGHHEAVEYLLEQNASANKVDFGKAPLTVAARWGQYSVVQLLLTHRADATLIEDKKTACEHATDPTIKMLLLQAEIDAVLNNPPKSQPGLFNASLAPLQQLKEALCNRDFVTVKKICDGNKDHLRKDLFQKALSIADAALPDLKQECCP